MSKIAPYWKAVVAFIAPGAVIITSAVTSGSDGGSTITTAEWITAVCGCVITSAAVGLTRNQPKMNA